MKASQRYYQSHRDELIKRSLDYYYTKKNISKPTKKMAKFCELCMDYYSSGHVGSLKHTIRTQEELARKLRQDKISNCITNVCTGTEELHL